MAVFWRRDSAAFRSLRIAEATGIEMTLMPYRGTGPMVTDLLAGRTHGTPTGGPAVLPAVRSEHLRALAGSSLTRLESASEIPTIAEAAPPGFEAVQWYGLVGPAALAQPIIARLNETTNTGVRAPELAARLAAQGAEPAPRTPAAFGELIAAEKERWTALIRRTGMRAD